RKLNKFNTNSFLKLRSLQDRFQIRSKIVVPRVVFGELDRQFGVLLRQREIVFESADLLGGSSLPTVRFAVTLEILANIAKHIEVSKIVGRRRAKLAVVVGNVQFGEPIVHPREFIFKGTCLGRGTEKCVIRTAAVLGRSKCPEEKIFLGVQLVGSCVFTKIIVKGIERIRGRWLLGAGRRGKAGTKCSKVVVLSV
ncbi:AAEL007960-PA, partial [Aedes aegypti]